MGEAVTQMDQATQQNAALVEEMAAAASALNAQAGELVNAVAVFKLDANSTSSHRPARTSAAPARAPMAAPSYKAPARSTSLGSSAKSRSKPASLAAPKTGSTAPAAPAASAAAPRPAAPSPAPAKAGGNDDDWESF